MSKPLKILLAVLLALVVATPAMAAKFEFHGDFFTRFMVYTNQTGFFNAPDTGTSSAANSQVLDNKDRADSWGEIKSRLVFSGENDDGSVKGVYALEVGALRFGRDAGVGNSLQGGFSGDGVNVETRWFYTDFQIPGVASKARFQLGLFSNTVNPFFWAETAMGVKFYTDNFYLAWLRGKEKLTTGISSSTTQDWGDGDLDSLTARYDLKMDPLKIGLFASYLWENVSLPNVGFINLSTFDAQRDYAVKKLPDMNFNLLALGVDGGWSAKTGFGKVFVNWDLIYEMGELKDVSFDNVTRTDADLSAYLLHADVGVNFGAATLTLTSYYASGNDQSSTSNDLDAYMAVDVDRTDSIIFQEGGYTDDNYFTERPYIHDWGLWLNKLALDFQATKKTKFGAAVLYLLTAEDAILANGTKENELGLELDAYVSHKIYDNLEFALNFGYLWSGDVMDEFETGTDAGNSKADVDIFRSTAMVRYLF